MDDAKNPKRWGPPTWWFLHWLANKVDGTIASLRAQGHTSQSDTKIQQTMLQQFISFASKLGAQLLPCHTCQTSTRTFLKLLPNVVKTFQTLKQSTASNWVFQLHNIVNQKLKKPVCSVQECVDFTSSVDFQSFPLQNIKFIEESILYCLGQWPRKRQTFTTTFRDSLSPLLWTLHNFSAFANISSTQSKALASFAERYRIIKI
jgi:hypothetical protein